MFATADSFDRLALARFLLGFVGAGFVIGIRMIGEWFPARQVGVAEGIFLYYVTETVKPVEIYIQHKPKPDGAQLDGWCN